MPAKNPDLTRAQLIALDHVSRGLGQKETARRMNTTQTAVCVMLRRARAKIGAKTTAHAIRLAIETGILIADRRERTS